jgi:signal transduction histidine kinase
VVEEHGGAIAVESKVGKGSIFTLSFPVLEGHSQNDEKALLEEKGAR